MFDEFLKEAGPMGFATLEEHLSHILPFFSKKSAKNRTTRLRALF